MRTLFVSQELPPETGWGGIGTYVEVYHVEQGESAIMHAAARDEGQDAKMERRTHQEQVLGDR